MLLVLLPLLAYLQYTWLGKVSEGEREQMQASLRRAADEFRNDFDREISGVYSSFQPRPPLPGTSREDYVESYFQWVKTARYPRLVNDVLLAEKSGAMPRIQRLNPATMRFERVEWPASLANLKAALAVEPERSSEPNDVFVWYLPRPIDPDIPALFIPVLQPAFERQEPSYLVLTLNLDCIQKEILPSLAGLLSSDYNVKVIDSNNPAKVIFRTGPTITGNENGDVRANLFTLRPPDILGARSGAIPAAGQRGIRNEIFSFRVFRGAGGEDSAAWQLVLTHRSGSVDAAVAQARRRNLAISSGILLLLAVSVAMIVISTGRAQRLARQQMEFVSGVSHELRTPLAVICSAGENLADGLVSDPEHARTYGRLVRDEGRRLRGMIEQVLDFAGIRSGRRIYNLRPTNPGEVINEALAAFNLQIQDLGFVIESQTAGDVPQIMADKPALIRAVQNLIGNALKYGGASRWIGIRAASAPNGVEIAVEDRGPGIASDELQRIFEPFYRGREAVEAQISGSGLGLSLVKEIVEAHGGTVTVDSTAGRGSSFRIVLPLHV